MSQSRKSEQGPEQEIKTWVLENFLTISGNLNFTWRQQETVLGFSTDKQHDQIYSLHRSHTRRGEISENTGAVHDAEGLN